MIDHLRIFKHENSPNIFELDGILTKKTLPTLIVNILTSEPFIMDFAKITGIDDTAKMALVDVSMKTRFVIWNANQQIKSSLEKAGIRTVFLPEDKKQ